MHFLYSTTLAFGLLSLFNTTLGQNYNHRKTRDLAKRSGTVNFNPNCNAASPTGSGYGNRFPTMQTILQQAYNDAVNLADQASIIQQSSPAYFHYFDRVNPTQQLHTFSMYTAIANNMNSFTITFECSGTAGNCGQNISASTDASSGGPTDNKVINVCPLFFTAAQTRYFLYDANQGANPGRPYRDNSGSGWCSNQHSDFYATAGHTILHELTHLDSLGTIADLDAPTQGPDAGRHGTDDLQTGFGFSGARDYKEDWDNSPDDDDSPDYMLRAMLRPLLNFSL